MSDHRFFLTVLMEHAEREIDTLIANREDLIHTMGSVEWKRALLRSIDSAESALRLHALRETQQHYLPL